MKKIIILLISFLCFSGSVKALDVPIGEGNFYLAQLKSSLNSISGVFDNFVSFTPDPTGLASCTLTNGLNCSLAQSALPYFDLPTKSASLPSTQAISDKLLILFIPLGVIMLALESYELILNRQRQRAVNIFKKIITVLVLLIITPYLLSLSILFINLLSSSLLSDSSLTAFISHFVDQLENAPSQNIFEAFFRDILEALDPGCNDKAHAALFVHNKINLIPKGEYYLVRSGTPIAIMGASGEAYGAHVHYAIKNIKTGEFYDPLLYILN